MAFLLGGGAVLLLAMAAVIGPSAASPVLRVVVALAQVAGPLLVVLAGGALLRHRLAAQARQWLLDVAGPALISTMPPRTVLDAVLAHVLGDDSGSREITSAILGGGGRDPRGQDTAVSRATSVEVRFGRIDEEHCLTEIFVSHEFSGVRNNHRLVLFATTDDDITVALARDRVYPLFESWRLENEDQLADFVPGLKAQLEIGVTYRDADGRLHVVGSRPVIGEQVAFRDYGRFVRLPPTADPQNLVIFALDLYDLTDPDHVVESVEGVTLRAATVGLSDLGFLTWSAPYPCFVERVVFDVRDLPLDDETLVYRVMTSALPSTPLPQRGRWVQEDKQIEVTVGSWMLPGHGVTLLWRPSED